MTREKLKPKKILMIADLGASAPKLIVSFKRNQTSHLILDSRTLKIPAFLFDKHREKEKEKQFVDEQLASEDAFLQLADDEEHYWVFGSLSKHFTSKERLDKNATKYQLGAVKILCGLGVLIQQEKLKYRNFDLDLCVLLPVDEFGYSEMFFKYFKRISKKWWFRGVEYSCSLRTTKVKREGASTLNYLLNHQDYQHQYQGKTIGLIMLGYRNLSFFLVKNGKAEVKESPVLGFHKCIENICDKNGAIKATELNAALANAYYSLLPHELEKVPGEIYDELQGLYNRFHDLNFNATAEKQQLEEGKLFKYEFSDYSDDSDHLKVHIKRKGKSPEFKNCEEIKELIKTQEPYNAEQELDNLIHDIDKEIKDYGKEFQLWLEQYLKDIDKLIVIGGASIFLYSWITDFCNRYDLLYIDQQKSPFPPPYESSGYNHNLDRKVIHIDSLPRLREELVKDFEFDAKDKNYSSIPLRFLDCYCFYKLCLKEIQEEEKAQRKQKKEQERQQKEIMDF